MKKPTPPGPCPTVYLGQLKPLWTDPWARGREEIRVPIGCFRNTLLEEDEIYDEDGNKVGLPPKWEQFYREGIGLDDKGIQQIVEEVVRGDYDEAYTFTVGLKALTTFAAIFGVDPDTVEVYEDPRSHYSRTYVRGYIVHTKAEIEAALREAEPAVKAHQDAVEAWKKEQAAYEVAKAEYDLWLAKKRAGRL